MMREEMFLAQIERFGSAEWRFAEIVSPSSAVDDGDGDGSSGVKTKANFDVKAISRHMTVQSL